jgi:hypothetical protein
MSLFRLLVTAGCWTAGFFCLHAFAQAARADDQTKFEFFEKKIRPVLIRHCYECHSSASKELKGGLRLDSREGIRKGGESGPAVVSGKVAESLLIEALRHESLEMPPDQKLPDAVIVDFVKWVERGAPDPRDRPPKPSEVAELSWQLVLESRRDWWSLRPVRRPAVPTAVDAWWSDRPIDRFIQAKLEDAGLHPAGEAEPRVLLRRLSLILTGLPPTPAEVAEFDAEIARNPTDGYEILADRLLDSPHFGERWARHWMDVVRFSETHGYEWNHEIRDVWQYRDYLIRAFNDDVPYDQFVREHVAGDLLESPRINHDLNVNESVIGTAFWRFGELGHDDCVQYPEIRFDALDNQIDTLTKAFQATTVSCARCHDHKFDPISTRDYYALVGILESSRQVVQTIDMPGRIKVHVERLNSLKQDIRRLLADEWLAALSDVDEIILTALQSKPPSGDDAEKTATPLVKQLSREKVAMEDPVSILQRIARLQSDEEVRIAWATVRTAYQQEQSNREKFNAENFKRWLSFDAEQQAGWHAAGLGPGDRPLPAGEFVVALTGDAAVSVVLPAGIYTHLLSSRLNGTVQSPWMPGDRKHVSVQFLGGGLSMIRSVVDSCALNEYVGGGLEYLSNDKMQWRTYPTRVDASHRAFLELTTKSDNVRWPDRPGAAGKDEALLQSPRSWFGVVEAVVHDCDETPRPELSHLLPLFEQPEPARLSDVAKTFRIVCRAAVLDWKNGKASDDDVRWINWMLSVDILPNSTKQTSKLARLVQDYRKLELTVPQPRVVAGMADQGSGFASPVLIRGNPLELGPLEPRRYLEIVAGSRSPFDTRGSGRLELADLIAGEGNPLTARVMVNRVWHHLFGSGLVRTPDDFGHLGGRPSHPELLDFLADRFVREGWSIKSLIRGIVTSRTFRQSSLSTAAYREVDPNNRLLHHFPVRRLDAEAIRDTILAVSGRLDRKLFGPSIQPFRAEAKEHRKLYAGPLDGEGRRSLYLKVTRMEGPRFLELFDLPDQTVTRGRRDRTNVPAQALALLNDPFVIGQSRVWGEALTARSDKSTVGRIDAVFLRALGRSPSTRERERMLGFVDRLAELHGVKPADIASSQEIWLDVAHAMFNMKELIYVR